MRQDMVAFTCATGCLVLLKEGHGRGKIGRRDPEPFRSLIEQIGGAAVDAWIRQQGKVMGQIRAFARKARAFRRDGDAVRQRNRVAAFALSNGLAGGVKAMLHFENGPQECSWIAAVEDDRIEAVQPQMLGKPGGAALLRHRRALIDAAAVLDHDRRHEPGIFRAPPARCPIAAALLFECAVREKGDEALTRQRHVDVLQFGEPQIPTFRQASGCMDVHVASQRRILAPLLAQPVRIKIPYITGQPFVRDAVPRGMGGRHVADEEIH